MENFIVQGFSKVHVALMISVSDCASLFGYFGMPSGREFPHAFAAMN